MNLTNVLNICKVATVTKETQLVDAYVAAHLYYERGFTQEEVARRMEVSRPTISKLLGVATAEGIVRVSVRRPGERDMGLQDAFTEALGLGAAAVLPGATGGTSTREILLAQGALGLLGDNLPASGGVGYMGLGWGRAMLAFVEALEGGVRSLGGTTAVVPLIGGSGQSLDIFQVNELARRAAIALDAPAHLLHAPALLQDARLREALLAEASLQPVVQAWRELDVAVVGIGKRLDPTYLAEYLQDEPLQHESLVMRSVGDVCSRYYAADGEALGAEHDAKLLAIGRADLGRVPLSVGVVGGPEKIVGMVGAARAGLVNALVTDEETARGCLKLAEADQG